ncbi:hypothetical protein HPP92_021761 [Vanilla planifolia]|uniref:Uncharacterized protein n=1 Tax=Vanilla planifolia TaxID=51239 RepID=A0A835UET0_VANPL|nr:hypothetical protein HPP92_021761 [Vanilla planifolia]
MVDAPKLLYIVVVDEFGGKGEGLADGVSYRYTRSVLQSTMQLMGCKARHAFKISRWVFEVLRAEYLSDCLGQDEFRKCSYQVNAETCNTIPFEQYKKAYDRVCYQGKIFESNLRCFIPIQGSRLGITSIISTDSIRHMMRSFVDEKQNPLLWASTYHAGECLDPIAVAEAKARRKAKKVASPMVKDELSDRASNGKPDDQHGVRLPFVDVVSRKQMAIEGFKAQSEMVTDGLDRLITAWENKKESVIVEGVHLSLNFVMGLMKKHPSIIPFMIYITNEEKHTERFAVRAKYMTLDPAKNKYVKYIKNIRTIQDYLCNRADKHLVPKINNTNVDRSVAAIHATIFSCLRRREAGEPLYDLATNTVPLVDEEYRNQCTANSLSSKGMFQLIQRKGSSRHLMALLYTDGSIAKAWPFEAADGSGTSISVGDYQKIVGNPMYGPLQIGKAEPVNLQFGNFGISAWPSDTGGTSHTGSFDDSRADGTDTGSRYFSSCCSSPRTSEAAAKELKENISVCGSEEADDHPDVDSDEDLSDVNKDIPDEMEGSVDANSTKSDEEYDDLAMRDGQGSDNWTEEEDDDELVQKPGVKTNSSEDMEDSGHKYEQNLDLFLKLSKQFSGSMLSGTRKQRSLSDSISIQAPDQYMSLRGGPLQAV